MPTRLPLEAPYALNAEAVESLINARQAEIDATAAAIEEFARQTGKAIDTDWLWALAMRIVDDRAEKAATKRVKALFGSFFA